MITPDPIDQLLQTWETHNGITLFLIAKIPKDGWGAVPTASRGRNVAEQLVHMNRVRLGWLTYHRTGKRPKLARAKGATPSRADLKKLFTTSGKEVSALLREALTGEVTPKMFGRNPVRWMGYLIAHESHHRGQIMLALKQNGLRMPEDVSVQGLWGRWIYGK